jgi:hypothetical protein
MNKGGGNEGENRKEGKREHAASTVTLLLINNVCMHYMNISSLTPHSSKNGPALKDGCE